MKDKKGIDVLPWDTVMVDDEYIGTVLYTKPNCFGIEYAFVKCMDGVESMEYKENIEKLNDKK